MPGRDTTEPDDQGPRWGSGNCISNQDCQRSGQGRQRSGNNCGQAQGNGQCRKTRGNGQRLGRVRRNQNNRQRLMESQLKC